MSDQSMVTQQLLNRETELDMLESHVLEALRLAYQREVGSGELRRELRTAVVIVLQ